MTRNCDERMLDKFYELIGSAIDRVGTRILRECHGRMNWPNRGVYFFFESGELRSDGLSPRIVRVGTHAVSHGSRTKLWNRLSSHRGTTSGGGNHRGSVFRKLVGAALLDRDESLVPKPATWGLGNNAPQEARNQELHVEQAVSNYIGAMRFTWIEIDDEPSRNSLRSYVERNSIALLSNDSPARDKTDYPSTEWLGHHSRSPGVRASGLWNVNHTRESCDPEFLFVLEKSISMVRYDR